MSKKMMKRTAALSALIAVALSGTVMASELVISYDNNEYTTTGSATVQGATADALYTALSGADMAGEMKTYASKKTPGKKDVSLEGGTYTSGPVKAIGQFAGEYSGNTLTVTGGSYVGEFRFSGAATYQGDINSNANNNTVTVNGVTMQKNGSKYPGVAGGWAWNDANENTITITSSSLDDALVYGGDAQYGDANKNIVNIEGSTVGWVNGGTTRYDGYDVMGNGKGNANENKVTIKDSTVIKTIKGGSAGGYANANNNIVDLYNVVFTGDAVDGGFAECGNVENNQVIIDGADTEITALVYGGRSQDKGSAIGNSVVINNGTFTNASYGIVGGITENEGTFGQGTEGDSLNNSVTISGGTINAKVYGGYSIEGAANENTVNITGGTVNDKVYGGYGVTEANGNVINITGITFGDDARLYGGSAYGEAVENVVNISNVTIKDNIIGGVSQNGGSLKGDAIQNTVKIEDSIIYGTVYGGDVASDHAADGDANNNEVIIKNSRLFDSGKYREISHVYGGCNNGDGDANGNKVTLIDVQMADGMYINAGYSGYGNANENEITVDGTDTQINGDIWGGRAHVDGNANSNKVTILNGTVTGSIYGGAANEKYNPWYEENSVTANNNEVVIENGTVNGDIYGGYAGRKDHAAYVAVANNNTVTIDGGTVSGKVYAGYSVVGTADNNTVNVGGAANLANASLYGSNHADSTGNTLNVNGGWSGDVKSVQNFNTINIEEAAWGTAAVTVTDTLALNDTTVSVGTVHVSGDDETFAPNGSSTVIAAGTITGDVSAGSSVEVYKGVATIYDASIVKDGNNINIQLAGEETAQFNPQLNTQVLVIGESRTAATAFVNQGSELIETGINSLALDEVTADETKVFAALYNGASKYETGSHIKVNGWSGIVGIGKTTDNGLTYGAFFESGEGNYRTYNDIDGMRMRGDGEANYNGGGLLIRKDNKNGIYTEASLRAGNLSNRLDGAVMGSEGLAGYDIDTTYYGAHVGIGKIIPKGKDSFDVYGKFIYTHHDSDTFEIDGDKFHFDSMDSQRLRLGFRYHSAQTAKVGLYYGAAYEYEFGGDADNTVVGYDLTTPSLEGSTVIGELGMHYIAGVRWSIDANLRGYTGQRDGWGGSIQANYRF